ncbi:hypothetical protein [Streptomyces sp. CA-111067]|uniref:hypothetical protein n=1 Tax=Streptomyces sp. CA-111067 TaxID=3240046 RepID=UPI003D99233A
MSPAAPDSAVPPAADPAPSSDGGAGGTGETAGETDSAVDVSRPGAVPSATGSAATAPGLVFDDPFDRPSADDSDRGWGDSPAGAADDDFARFLNEKPPHHN